MLSSKFLPLLLAPLAWALTIPRPVDPTSNTTSEITFDITFEVTVDVTPKITPEAGSPPDLNEASNTTSVNTTLPASNDTLPASNITLPAQNTTDTVPAQNFTLPPPPGPSGPAPLCFWSPSPEMHDSVCRYRCVDECADMSAENGRALFFTQLVAEGKKCFDVDKDGRPGVECWKDANWTAECWEIEFPCAPW